MPNRSRMDALRIALTATVALWSCAPAASTNIDAGAFLIDAGEISDAGVRDAGSADAGPTDAGCHPVACTTGVSCDDLDNGCGETLHCGACPDALLCGGTGTPNVCSECAAPTLQTSLPWGHIGSNYSSQLNATGYGVNRYSIVQGTLPPGLSLGDFGSISGQPHDHGRFDFTLEVGDSCPTPHAERFNITLIVDIPGDGATSVTNGLFHSLAVTYGGVVLAWGNNQDLTLGSDVADVTMARYQPAPVLDAADHSVGNAVAVAATDRASFALLSNGQVLSWGKNDSGVLGDGSLNSRGRAGPVVGAGVQPLANITALAAGQEHVLALTTTGTVFAWGRGDDGRLGDGTTSSQSSAQPVLTSAGMPLDHVIGIAATARASAALLDNHHIVTWGDDTHRHLFPAPLTWTGGAEVDNVTAIAGGSSHFLALTSDGSVIAWGDNEQGELGNGRTLQYDQEPAYVLSAENTPLNDVTAIAAGDRCSFALRHAGVVGWGKNNIGELGDGTNVLSRPFPVATKTYLGTDLSGVTGIAASRSTAWGFLGSGQHLVGWGDNSLGKLAMPWGFTTSRNHSDYVLLP